uniref:Cytochrome b5 heme-binding domain-containing protein n=1 Tax=Acrobeloides nanus TaxID=290746 RepID=A0A914CK31_9BILA
MADDKNLRIISTEEVEEHNSENSVWIILNDKVYDVTQFLLEHPGGEDVILQQAGLDATEAFNDAGHSMDAIEMTKEYLIGRLPDNEMSNPPSKYVDEKIAQDSYWNRSTVINYLVPMITVTLGVYLSYKLTQRFVKV